MWKSVMAMARQSIHIQLLKASQGLRAALTPGHTRAPSSQLRNAGGRFSSVGDQPQGSWGPLAKSPSKEPWP